jgi:hypothetical protein
MPAAAGAASTRETIHLGSFARFTLGGDQEVVYFPGTGVAHLLSSKEAGALTTWRMLHTGRAPDLDIGRPTDIVPREVMAALERSGSLASCSALLAAALAPSEPETAFSPGIPWLAIPTRARPRALQRALRSYVANTRAFGNAADILVVGDDDTPAASRITEGVGGGLDAGRPIQFAGRAERRRFAEALGRGGALPPDVLSFALLGDGPSGSPTMGATRNSILLARAGERVLCVDDDTMCVPAEAPTFGPRSSLVLSGPGDPSEFWFFEGRRQAWAAVRRQPRDVVAGHARFLGAQVCDVVGGAGPGHVEMSGLPSVSAHALRRGRLRITLNGVVGDCGMHSGAALRVHPGPGTRERMLRSERDYHLAVSCREVIRQAPSTTITGCQHLVGMFMGIDNQELPPPFMPVYRNEDGLFGFLLDRCFEDAYACHLPWVLLHAPEGARTYDPLGVSGVRVSDVVLVCAASWSGGFPGQSPRQRMASLGAELQDLASIPEPDFAEYLRQVLTRRALNLIANREALLIQHAGHPLYWAGDVRSQVDVLLRQAGSRPGRPADLLPEPGASPGRSLQSFLRRFGDLLQWWPHIWERARELRQAGVSMDRQASA